MMNISPFSLLSYPAIPSIGEMSNGNPLGRGRLVVAGDKSAAGDIQTQAALAKKTAQADQLDLLEEARKLAEELEAKNAESENKDENVGRKVTAQDKEKPVEQKETSFPKLKKMPPLDLSGILAGIFGNEEVAEKFSGYQGSGDATTSAEVDETLADKEHWMFSYGRDIDLESAGLGAQRGTSYSYTPKPPGLDGAAQISYGTAGSGDGYGMRVRYDASSEDNSVMIVEAVDVEGNRTAYRVDLKEIDAANATLIESFALVSHLHMTTDKTAGGIRPLHPVAFLMNNIIDQPRRDPASQVTAVFERPGYTVRMGISGGESRTNGRPSFDTRYNLLSLLNKPVYEAPKDGSFLGREIYM